MDAGHDEFFAIVGEGAALLKNLDEQSSGFFDDLNRLREILSMLGFGSANKPLEISLEDKAGAAKALSDYLNNGIKALPDAIKAFEALSVRSLAEAVGDTLAASEARNIAGAGYVRDASEPAKLAAFDHFTARGVDHGIPQDELQQMQAKAADLLKTRVDDSPEYIRAQAEYSLLSNERQEAYNEVSRKLRAAVNANDEAAVAELVKERNRLSSGPDPEQDAAWARLNAASKKFYADRTEAVSKLLDANGEVILAKIAAASPVTAEQATAWASAQIIDPSAAAKLKKLGYPPEDVIRDMAEYYRLTGGKASTIRLSIDGGRRANAVGITARAGGERIINLGASFDKTTLFHELAHHLEADPIANAAANGFLIKRRESARIYRLRTLTGNKGYATHEKAYKDHFMDAYVGKVYDDGITEVWSMGVQYLANPRNVVRLAAKDPEMFALITGYLSTPLTPAQAAKLNLHSAVLNGAVQKRDDEVALFERAIEFLAAKAPLSQDGWFESLDKEGSFYASLSRYILSEGNNKYMGGNGNYHVFSAKVRNPNTKRVCKGFVVVDSVIDESRPSWSSLIDSMTAVTMTQVQALIALANRDNAGLKKAAAYFKDRKNMIETVGIENLQ